jgi:hypothetical protein
LPWTELSFLVWMFIVLVIWGWRTILDKPKSSTKTAAFRLQ